MNEKFAFLNQELELQAIFWQATILLIGFNFAPTMTVLEKVSVIWNNGCFILKPNIISPIWYFEPMISHNFVLAVPAVTGFPLFSMTISDGSILYFCWSSITVVGCFQTSELLSTYQICLANKKGQLLFALTAVFPSLEKQHLTLTQENDVRLRLDSQCCSFF